MRHSQAIEEFLATRIRGTSAGAVEPDQDLLAHGVLDSMGVMQLVAWICERFAVDLDGWVPDADELRSVRAIDAFITRQVAAGSERTRPLAASAGPAAR
ncbi:acyl carrier protein (plasmid) [Streptomyces sp. cg28]|uniref:acyl carrier protein n=1 Tax=Streptomyces sp. cg28 TaxID=3403457 RepID=UPI003B2197E9